MHCCNFHNNPSTFKEKPFVAVVVVFGAADTPPSSFSNQRAASTMKDHWLALIVYINPSCKSGELIHVAEPPIFPCKISSFSHLLMQVLPLPWKYIAVRCPQTWPCSSGIFSTVIYYQSHPGHFNSNITWLIKAQNTLCPWILGTSFWLNCNVHILR